MAARTLDDLRRIVARIGTDAAAHQLDATIPVAIRHPARPTADVATVPPVGRGTATRAIAAPAVRVSGGAARIAVRPAHAAAVGGGCATTVREGPAIRPCTVRVATLATTGVAARSATGVAPSAPAVQAVTPRMAGSLGTGTIGADAARRMRRAPVAWAHISARRLRAAWRAVLAEHGYPGADLELVGVYGPLPVDAVASVALAGDRQAVIDLVAGARRSASGDIALARHTPTGRLLRSAGAISHVDAGP